ncbi:hypothetical protein HD600_001358 [Microbacterium ginsengiterrae]|uniref:DUF4185 domain-containing protein n=1 Tax=Microbacterium ginsengiterrae TaxID=546115 RepID=A0A7W9CC39_9MICO|nr:DUF4185 domain-containing protein [Microbacterium ginsengiterrae]MBB5742861.1 hypothetical protein [Microbacterium ginsengiterrae]
MRNRKHIAAIATAASVLAGGLLAAPASAVAPAGHGDGQCSLAGATLTATASVNGPLTEQFTTYAETGGAWTGGDSTYTLPLKGGRTGWFFSDSFLGTVNPDGSRPAGSPFVNNSVVVQTSKGLSTVTGGTPDAPVGIIPPEPDGRWYWIGDPADGPRGTVQVPLLQFERTGTGSFDFQWTANRLATLDGDSLQLESIVDLPSATGINWGSWTLEEGNHTYIYGIADPEGVRSSYVARTTGMDRLAGEWTFWNGADWVADETDAVPVVPYVANEFSVAKYRDGYLLITQDTSELFSTRIVARTGCSPTGPFSEPVELYRTPETGLAGSYGDADVFTYNAHEHPNLRTGNRLLVTYNVNTFDNVGDVYDDASIYRPRFIDVELQVRR